MAISNAKYFVFNGFTLQIHALWICLSNKTNPKFLFTLLVLKNHWLYTIGESIVVFRYMALSSSAHEWHCLLNMSFTMANLKQAFLISSYLRCPNGSRYQ
jgi:hypothetical protein